jgi:translation initiation factor 5
MSGVLNIDPQKKDDMYYRYKMPAAIIKIEGSGNGIKTVFPNLREICKALGRPEDILLKFLGNELGAQSTFQKDVDKFLVMGSFPQDRVQLLVYRFIERYVLCKKCRNPETDVSIGKKQKIFLECRGCGEHSEVNQADKTYNHVLLHFKSLAPKEGAAAPTATTEVKEAPEEKPSSPTTSAPSTATASKAPKAGATIESSTEQKENPIDILARHLNASTGNYNIESSVQLVFRLKSDYALKDANVVRLVFRAIIHDSEADPSARFIETIGKNLQLLKRFSDGSDNQSILIRECQILCRNAKSPHKFMMLMKLLVEEGVVADKEVYAWYEGKAKDVTEEESKTIKEISAPFIRWLKGESVGA